MIQTLTIDKPLHGGECLARHDGRTYFVSGTIPGETVRARVYGKKAQCILAHAVEIIDPSPDRITPVCPYVPHCGGCLWQHIAYERQIALKKEIFLDCLRRIGKITAAPDPHVLSGPPLQYRHRVQLKIDTGKNSLGFFRRDSNEVVDISHCPVLVPELNKFLTDIRSGPYPTCTQLRAIAGTNATVTSDPVIKGISEPQTGIRVNDIVFNVKGDSFFQQNRPLTPILTSWVSEQLSGDTLLDLYGGIGLFSAACAARFNNVTLVESENEQVHLAQRTFHDNGLGNCTAVAAMAERYLSGEQPRPSCVLVDPPRTGLSKVVRDALGRMGSPVLMYVSCDPATQARDVGCFISEFGYRITATALFDLYPQTPHMESAIILQHS